MTAVKTKVFISHSGWSGVVSDVGEALLGVFKGSEDFEALIDRFEVRGGDELIPAIDGMIDRCDAAVVMMGQRALDVGRYRWVFYEVGRLKTRGVTVIPIYMEGVKPDHIAQSWAMTGLPPLLHFIYPELSAAQLVAEVVLALQPTVIRVRASAVSRGVARLLGRFAARDLEDAAEPLKTGAWHPAHICSEVAERLLAESGPDPTGHFASVMAVLKALAWSDYGSAERVRQVVVPFTWANAEVAGQLRQTIESARFAGLGARKVATSDAHVKRDPTTWPQWKVLPFGAGSDTEYAHLAEDLDEMLTMLDAGRKDRGYTADQYDPASNTELLAIVCDEGLDPAYTEVIDQALAKHPYTRIVFLVGDLDDDRIPLVLRERLEVVTPKVDPDDEDAGIDRLVRSEAALRQISQDSLRL